MIWNKNVIAVSVSRDMLLAHGMVEPNAEERAELEAWKARKVAAQPRIHDAVERLAAVTDLLSRRLLELHARNDRGECEGCDFSGYDCEPPEWPCRTVVDIAHHNGISGLDEFYLYDETWRP